MKEPNDQHAANLAKQVLGICAKYADEAGVRALGGDESASGIMDDIQPRMAQDVLKAVSRTVVLKATLGVIEAQADLAFSGGAPCNPMPN